MTDAPKPGNVGNALLLRIISSAVLIPVAIACVYFGGIAFVALVVLMMAVMLYEWCRMVEGRDFGRGFWVLIASAAGGGVAAAFGSFGLAMAIAGAGVAVSLYLTRDEVGYWVALAGPYIIAPSIGLVWLRNAAPEGLGYTIVLFAVVWAADIGAFVCGKLIGGPKISHALSPSKTWAGIGGGIGGGIGAGFVAAPYVFDFNDAALAGALLGGGLGASSVIGDLAESAIKRRYGLKDISSLIPGHGGVLDRLDGMIFATAAMTSVYFMFMISGWG